MLDNSVNSPFEPQLFVKLSLGFVYSIVCIESAIIIWLSNCTFLLSLLYLINSTFYLNRLLITSAAVFIYYRESWLKRNF
jgi:hypothetical protein